MPPFDRFHQIAADPSAYARQRKESAGSAIVGHMCTYTPEELIVAAGAMPYRIFGASHCTTSADAHLQSYSCSMVRIALEDALSGQLSFLDGTVFPHTCDSFQRLSDIWRRNTGLGFQLDLVLPVKLNTESAQSYIMEVLTKFKRELESALATEITDRDLENAIRSCNQARRLLQQLYAFKIRHPGAVSIRDLHHTFKAAMIMEKTEFIDQMTGVLSALDSTGATEFSETKPVVVTGGICLVPDVLHMIEESGGRVVGDDLCTGARYGEGVIHHPDDGLAALADRFRSLSLCPTKHDGLNRRIDDLIGLVRERRARGVLILTVKFCDPHCFDVPYLTEALNKADIASLVLEIEAQMPPGGQLRTRIEAFLEML